MTVSELKKAVEEKKIILGKDRTIKKLRRGEITKVFLASNCSKDDEEEIKHLAKIGSVKVEKLKQPNEEVGLLCKKSFSISVLGY